MNGNDSAQAAEEAATPSALDAPPHKPKKKDRTIGQIQSELSKFAATQQLGRKGRQRIEEIVNETARLVAKGPAYRRLYQRALRIQREKIMPPPRAGKRRGGPAGLVMNPGLSQGGREVLGGLPSSRRGY